MQTQAARIAMRLRTYLVGLTPGRMVLWCYLLWYLVILTMYFDPAPALWLNSLGISAVIGFALTLSVRAGSTQAPGRWATFRLFAMPFCVSSFSALIKGHGFYVVVPPSLSQAGVCVGACAWFVGVVRIVQVQAARSRRPRMRHR